MTRVGFTGTLAGMSPAQRALLPRVLRCLAGRPLDHTDPREARPEFHHGAAPGADTEAEAIAADEGWVIRSHPATRGRELARNREIVAAIELLIAAPRQDREVRRSGTWATIRYARQAGIPIVMLPRGEV